jgi:hypothetical protein
MLETTLPAPPIARSHRAHAAPGSAFRRNPLDDAIDETVKDEVTDHQHGSTPNRMGTVQMFGGARIVLAVMSLATRGNSISSLLIIPAIPDGS